MKRLCLGPRLRRRWRLATRTRAKRCTPRMYQGLRSMLTVTAAVRRAESEALTAAGRLLTRYRLKPRHQARRLWPPCPTRCSSCAWRKSRWTARTASSNQQQKRRGRQRPCLCSPPTRLPWKLSPYALRSRRCVLRWERLQQRRRREGRPIQRAVGSQPRLALAHLFSRAAEQLLRPPWRAPILLAPKLRQQRCAPVRRLQRRL